MTSSMHCQASLSEDAAWDFLTQLAAALRAVHSMGLACRIALAPSKVLLLPGGRIKLGKQLPPERISCAVCQNEFP